MSNALFIIAVDVFPYLIKSLFRFLVVWVLTTKVSGRKGECKWELRTTSFRKLTTSKIVSRRFWWRRRFGGANFLEEVRHDEMQSHFDFLWNYFSRLKSLSYYLSSTTCNHLVVENKREKKHRRIRIERMLSVIPLTQARLLFNDFFFFSSHSLGAKQNSYSNLLLL